MPDGHRYRMTISLGVLKDLGIGLYSNIPAVLAELVANAWDADAKRVDIDIDIAGGTVIIRDNGTGMTVDDINHRYLRIGYDKRKEKGDLTTGVLTGKPRHVMGWKGIGKLSVFSISKMAEVKSVKGAEQNALRMDRDAIRLKVETENPVESGVYNPVDIRDEVVFGFGRGTEIILHGFDKKLNWTETYLRRRLARRFSVLGASHSFEVAINGKSITASDRDFYSKIQFGWIFGDRGRSALDECTNIENIDILDPSVERLDYDVDGASYSVDGWIGTVFKPENIGDENNTITIFAHGKVVQEDILSEIKEARVFAEYIIGEIYADFLDDTDRDDIATSDRQRLKQTDPRYAALKTFVGRRVKDIGNRWDALRKKGAARSALELPAVKEWYLRLTRDQRPYAERMFGRIESLKLPSETARKELYRASVMAFERLAYRDALDDLREIRSEKDFDLLKRFFDRVDDLEAVQYYQIVKGRLDVLEKMDALRKPGSMDAGKIERVVAEYVFDHLWLLDPSWERATASDEIQQTISEAVGSEPVERIDLGYRKAAGRHVLVDLRPYSSKTTIGALVDDAERTITTARAALEDSDAGAPVELVLILGQAPSRPAGGFAPPTGPIAVTVDDASVRYVTYEDLITNSRSGYREFLERQSRVSEIVGLIERIEQEFDAALPEADEVDGIEAETVATS